MCFWDEKILNFILIPVSRFVIPVLIPNAAKLTVFHGLQKLKNEELERRALDDAAVEVPIEDGSYIHAPFLCLSCIFSCLLLLIF